MTKEILKKRIINFILIDIIRVLFLIDVDEADNKDDDEILSRMSNISIASTLNDNEPELMDWNAYDVDGEGAEFLLDQLNLKEQLLSQLVKTMPSADVINAIKERINLDKNFKELIPK